MVTDEGPGFDVSWTEEGEGLQIMGDRVAALDGELVVDSQPGRGTSVSATFTARALEVAT